MVSETEARTPFAIRGPAWPPHDTEESVLGTDLHQGSITNLRWGINEAARVGLAAGQPVPWQAFSQTALIGCRRPEGSLYRTYPDVFVYPRALDRGRGAAYVASDGPPALIIEVLSEATHEADGDLDRGKGWSYADAGVREYLTYDQGRSFAPEGIRAWRLVDGRYQPWLPDADGRWRSETIGVAFALEDDDLIVYTRDGRRMLREGEVEAERQRLRAAMTQAEAELARLRRLLAERGG